MWSLSRFHSTENSTDLHKYFIYADPPRLYFRSFISRRHRGEESFNQSSSSSNVTFFWYLGWISRYLQTFVRSDRIVAQRREINLRRVSPRDIVLTTSMTVTGCRVCTWVNHVALANWLRTVTSDRHRTRLIRRFRYRTRPVRCRWIEIIREAIDLFLVSPGLYYT